MKEEKTLVMRILDKEKVKYEQFCYLNSGKISGEEVAEFLHLDKNQTFKTLVTISKSGNYYVFDVPVNKELDLKKAAASVNEKNVSMLPQKELLPLTGYVHGGCSPIGMKKFFKTTFDISALEFDKIYFSAGKVGYF